MSESDNKPIKICRQCHSVYKSETQKFCGNGCEHKAPHFLDGKINAEIEPREITLTPNSDNIIRWICISCLEEYSAEDVKEKSHFTCAKCNIENTLYPFTQKSCANCKNEDGTYYNLSLGAKVCDKCAKGDFVLNQNKIISKFKKQSTGEVDPVSDLWDGVDNFNFTADTEKDPENKNVISITFTVLNNNCKYISYGEGRVITVDNLIKDSPGFMPNEIYMSLIEKYQRNAPLFTILFNKEKEEFSLNSALAFTAVQLDPRYHPKTDPETWEAEKPYPLPESKLLQLTNDFFKIHIWVY